MPKKYNIATLLLVCLLPSVGLKLGVRDSILWTNIEKFPKRSRIERRTYWAECDPYISEAKIIAEILPSGFLAHPGLAQAR